MMSIFQKSLTNDGQGMTTDEKDYEGLMERILCDEMELATIENRINDEFALIKSETKNIISSVDRTVGN